MSVLYNLSIRNKLIAITLFVTILALGIGFTLIIVSNIKSFKEDMKNNTIVTAQVIGDYCVSPLVFEDSAGAEQILSKLADVPSITKARVYDTNGELFVSFATSEEPVALSPIVRERSSEFLDNYLHVYQPIIYKDEYYGMIYLQASTQLLDTKIRDYLRYMALLMVGLTIVAVFLAIRLQRIISKPILNLARVAQQIAEEKNYTIRVQKQGNDETGLLYDGFNNMLDQVQRRETERDGAYDALRESEEKFRTLTSNIPGAIYRCANDPDWTIDFISDVIEQISGYKASDFIQNRIRSYASIVLPNDRKMVGETVNKAISNREPYLNEYRIIRSDGHIRWVYEKGQGVFSDDGNLLWLDGAIFDITERKLVEEELAKHRDHLEDLVEIRTIEITKANKQLQQEVIDRKKAEEVIATRLRYEEGLAACSRILLTGTDTKEDLSEALGYLLTAANTSRVYIFENFEDEGDGLCMRQTQEIRAKAIRPRLGSTPPQHIPYKQGFDRWRKLLSKGEPINGIIETFPSAERKILEPHKTLSMLILPITVDEEWYGFIGFDDVQKKREWSDEDIRSLRTASEMIGIYIETKLFEEALRVSEERFRSLVENANDIIYSLTPEGIFSYVSPNWTEILGHKVSEVIGKSFIPFVHPDDLQACMDFFKKVIEFGKKQSGIEYRIQHKNKQWKWHTTNASPLKDEEGNVVSYIGIAHDFTEMKKILNDLEMANQHLRETQAQLVQSAKMASLGNLVAGIAHEINTPIGAVNSMQDTLFRTLENLRNFIETQYPKDQKKASKLKENFKFFDESKKLINSGTERVINIVKRLRSFARLDEAELKTVDIHEGLEDTLTLIHHDIKHNIQVKKTYGDLPLVSCYPGKLNQVFLNILVNAKQAIKRKGIIDITTYTKQKNVFIEIKDNGEGIKKEHLKKVFDPGFTTKGVGVGTGLGLSICYQIMQDHMGEILVESEVNKGTSFTVVLPMDLDDKINQGSVRLKA